MPSTTVHFQVELLDRIDEVATRLGISRNKFIADACRRSLEEDSGAWPEDFFKPDITDDDWELLREGTRELESAVAEHRLNRGATLL